MPRHLDLARLLDPLTPQVFFEQYWEKKPLHLRRSDAHYYDEVLTIDVLERLIASPEARYPAVQLSKGGGYFPQEMYGEDVKFGSVLFTGVPNVQKIVAEYRAGATVVLPALQRTWAPLRGLCAALEADLTHAVHANAYLTPGNTAGFTPHYDTHEVVVLQLAGKKHWHVYAPPIELPHRKQPFNPMGYVLPSEPLLAIDLAPGDLLYLPRGYVHTTTTSELHSAHITIGIAVYTWLDLVGELLQAGMASPRLRQGLPPGFAGPACAAPGIKEQLDAVLDTLRSEADGERLIESFLGRVRANKPLERGVFKADVTVIHADTRLQAPDSKSYRLVPQGAKIAVEFQQRRFILPGDARAPLELMRARRAFTALDLPGPLTLEAKLTLVRTLHERGFLTISSLADR